MWDTKDGVNTIAINTGGHIMGAVQRQFRWSSCSLESLASRPRLFIYSEAIHLSHLSLSLVLLRYLCFLVKNHTIALLTLISSCMIFSLPRLFLQCPHLSSPSLLTFSFFAHTFLPPPRAFCQTVAVYLPIFTTSFHKFSLHDATMSPMPNCV